MVTIKVYISGISGNKEVKKRQQRVLMILDSKNIKYEAVDIAEPGNEEAKEFMQNNSKSLGATVGDANPRSPLPPQLFSDDEYCGDYDQFDLANEVDEIEKFLKLPYDESVSTVTSSAEIKLGNGEVNTDKVQNDNEAEAKQEVPEEAQNETPAQEEKVTSDSKLENEVESETKTENAVESEVKTENVVESEVKTENEVEAETKTENGSAEADSSPTDVAV